MVKKLSVLVVGLLVSYTTIQAQNWAELPVPENQAFLTLDFVDEHTGYIAGNYGTVYKTINAGKNWVEILGISGHATSLDFINENTGLIGTASGEIYKTNDSGVNWLTVYTSSQDINDIYYINSNEVIATTSTRVLKSNDGGANWQTVYTEKKWSYASDLRAFYAVSFLNSSLGVAAGQGSIIVTTDGGNTWSKTNGIPSAELTTTFSSISYIEESKFFVVGYDAWMNPYNYISNDGGNTWNPIVEMDLVENVNFSSPTFGIVSGRWGHMMSTSDGGYTWSDTNTGTVQAVYDLHIVNENIIYGSEYGKLLRKGLNLKTSFNSTIIYPPNLSVNLDITTEISWSIISNNDWMSVSQYVGNGSSTVAINLQQNNTGQLRTGTIKILSDFNPDKTITIKQEPTSVDIEKLQKQDILLYPNPTNAIIYFEFGVDNIQNITISDITGKQLFEKSVIQQNEQIDLSSFESGIYIVKIQSVNEILTTKIVKE